MAGQRLSVQPVPESLQMVLLLLRCCLLRAEVGCGASRFCVEEFKGGKRHHSMLVLNQQVLVMSYSCCGADQEEKHETRDQPCIVCT